MRPSRCMWQIDWWRGRGSRRKRASEDRATSRLHHTARITSVCPYRCFSTGQRLSSGHVQRAELQQQFSCQSATTSNGNLSLQCNGIPESSFILLIRWPFSTFSQDLCCSTLSVSHWQCFTYMSTITYTAWQTRKTITGSKHRRVSREKLQQRQYRVLHFGSSLLWKWSSLPTAYCHF